MVDGTLSRLAMCKIVSYGIGWDHLAGYCNLLERMISLSLNFPLTHQEPRVSWSKKKLNVTDWDSRSSCNPFLLSLISYDTNWIQLSNLLISFELSLLVLYVLFPKSLWYLWSSWLKHHPDLFVLCFLCGSKGWQKKLLSFFLFLKPKKWAVGPFI